MNRFKKIVSKLGGEDKLLHVESCCLMVMVLSVLFSEDDKVSFWLASLVGAGVFGIGIMKEAYDATHGESFDLKDLLADFIGVVIGVLIILILL